MKEFLVVHLVLMPQEPAREILIALLNGEGYDSFEETEEGLRAYILIKDFKAEVLENLPYLQQEGITWSYTTEHLSAINWNEEWERNYQPVFVDNLLHIRAPFHPAKEGFKHEILIEPKMSFGTGHHQTTRLMATSMFRLNWQNEKVLDMGTGTGVLAILAEKMGAEKVLAVDNFDWAAENTKENAQRNNCTKVEAKLGDAMLLEGLKFTSILANINRNVLLEDMSVYAKTLSLGGKLIMSGFLIKDFDKINDLALRLGFELKDKLELQNWLCCYYQKL
jgi:ribosomal protein L11 methyltransferase